MAWSTVQTIVLAVILGFVFPLLRARFHLKDAVRQVLLAEGLSIAVMETAEVLVEVYTPGAPHPRKLKATRKATAAQHA